jgi:hypothetical protein
MVTLASLMAACLDPAQAGLVLAIVIAYRGPLPTVLAGAAGALSAETFMAFAAAGYGWGELFAPRLVAALLQASAAAFIVWVARSAARGAWAALAPDDRLASAPDSGTAALDAPELRIPPPRMALWHMRAHARLRTYRLHKKKTAALNCESR